MEPILSVKNIRKIFPGVVALDDVSLDFYPGEAHALVGENGAGKSTLIKIISGVYTPTEGRVLLDGKEVRIPNPRAALDHKIAVIHQELSIANDLTVAENIYLGEEPRIGGSALLDRKKMNADAQQVLDFMRVNIKAAEVSRNLTAAHQQMVEIAKVITKRAKVVIMDEPTSSLSDYEIESLFKQIGILKEHGVAVIYITHRLKELFEICDRVTVMRDGRVVNTLPIAEATEREIVRGMVGREMKDYYMHTARTRGKEKLRVESLSCGRFFSDVSFTAYSGEILGLYGLVGAGRTEVVETIFGARAPTAGAVYVEGERVDFKSPRDAIGRGIGLVTEDRRTTGLMLGAKLKENVVLPSLTRNHKKGGFLDLKWEDEIAADFVGKLKIKTPSTSAIIRTLSGGNQQKVILAKWLVANSNILILDEPTRGIDVNAKSEFYSLMNIYVSDGGCIVAVSSELPEIMGISDRILVMREGKISGELSREEATEHKIIELASLHSEA
jgi:ABC-type sugar transport system ATPase subunit